MSPNFWGLLRIYELCDFWTKFETSAHSDVAYPRENVTKSSIIKKGNDDDMIDWGDSPFWPFLQQSMIHGTVPKCDSKSYLCISYF